MGISAGLGCQGFHLPILMEPSRAQPPLGNLPTAPFLRVPHVTHVTHASCSLIGNFLSGWGK
ncbi:MAG TPA: hypothetical protein VK141_10130 [Nitrosomonas sp.]|nr:hypothetical protein [Nitrosomonas sp.]